MIGLIISIMFFGLFNNLYGEINYCKIADEQVRCFANEMSKNHCLRLEGSGGAMMDDIQSFYLSFSSLKSPNIEEARYLVVNCVENFLQRINNAKKLRTHLHEYPYLEKDFKLIILFKDTRGNFIDKSHITMVSAGNGKVFYNILQNPPYGLEEAHHESYEEALKIVQSQTQAPVQ